MDAAVFARVAKAEDALLEEFQKFAEASDNLKASSDSEALTISNSAVLAKEFITPIGGIIRAKFDLKSRHADLAAYGQIYRNGVALGTSRTTAAATYKTFSEDLAFAPYDLIQLYFWGSSGGGSAVQNFRLYYDKIASEVPVVTYTL